ncbi:tRNA lysidine(34) synthetase [Ferrimonas marina]|uniref:3'-phosphoadenosine 5'-phosphosulfate sulfotransferase (PAPS reductase)/FAD synthetase n=1 Tax=Ferrimonas marina TaxID=299255 RepID=A0A1M5U0I8_9GAMM|nr:hypothetical protein [Ferrimonas marina]SHH56595.1 3'-phosphoadenosine 5'-phosphosulfate sulfotransferase (PAPS reductase)/FAD synthetase [Ferrimonas marina]
MLAIDISGNVNQQAEAAFTSHEALVAEYLALLAEGYCLQIGLSYGKDSKTVTNAALDAMRRAIDTDLIEADHPLVVVTVDTLLEPENLQCYVPFAARHLQDYCENHDINLQMRIVTPPLHQQLMILFAGAQKLPATAMSGRHADCSLIWKVNQSIAALKQIKQSLPKKYQDRTWVSISGSRSEESSRRSHNMNKQGVRGVKAAALIDRVRKASNKPGQVFKFAPIGDWTVQEVLNYLAHCGDKSMSRTLPNQRIEAFMPHYGVLLQIYGEGSNDVCEMVSNEDGKQEQSKGCGGVARYGCVTCGMVSNDHSAKELLAYPRWAVFGDSTLRFRDYMVRVGTDINQRAYHARAYDPVANCNVLLQPNVLKARVLEHMVQYAAQITVDSQQLHRDFVELYEQGRVDEHPGVQDIMADTTMIPKVRREYRKMYIERLRAAPMFNLFTEQHAVLLSLMWALHGVAALPYRPVKILDDVRKGKRLPFPLTNSELNAKLAAQGRGKWDSDTELNREVPEAIAVQLFKPVKKSFAQLKAEHGDALSAEHLQDYLPIPLENLPTGRDLVMDPFGRPVQRPNTLPTHTRRFQLTYAFDPKTGEEAISAKDGHSDRQINLSRDPALRSQLLSLGRRDLATAFESQHGFKASVEEIHADIIANQAGPVEVSATHEFAQQRLFESEVVDYSGDRKAEPAKGFSRRKRQVNKQTGAMDPGRASLKTYKASTDCVSHRRQVATVGYWMPDFTLSVRTQIDLHDQGTVDLDNMQAGFNIDSERFHAWLKEGAWGLMLAQHDAAMQQRIAKRLPLRAYHGTAPAYFITSNSGVSTSVQFADYMTKALSRTECFHKAGLFNLGQMPSKLIAHHPSVVTMAQHRSQKANHLLAIRHLRNLQRRRVHALGLTNTQDAAARVIQRLDEFAGQYQRVAKQHLAASLLQHRGEQSRTKLDITRYWLLEHGPALTSEKAALALLATQAEQKAIVTDRKALAAVRRAYCQASLEIAKHLDQTGTQLSALVSDHQSQDGFEFGEYCYEITGDTGATDALADWICEQLPGTNHYSTTSYLITMLAFAHGMPQQCAVFGKQDSENTPQKLADRAHLAKEQMKQVHLSAKPRQLEVFSALYRARSQSAELKASRLAMAMGAITKQEAA